MGFGVNIGMSNTIGAVLAIVCLVAFLVLGRKPVAGAPDINDV